MKAMNRGWITALRFLSFSLTICKLHRTSEYMVYEDSLSFSHDQALENYTSLIFVLTFIHREEITATIPFIEYNNFIKSLFK